MIRLEDVSIEQGNFSLQQVNLSIAPRAYAVLMGSTGSGKTTLLEVVCGVRPIRSGRIFLDERDVTRLPPGARGIGYVPQDGALFQTMTVREQLGFALEIRRVRDTIIRERVLALSEMLEITHLLDRSPRGLSGGETQRVALGRALAFWPRILLLDEPLAALDETMRQRMLELLEKVHAELEVTVLHVTHGEQEATRLGRPILELQAGRIAERRALAQTQAIAEDRNHEYRTETT